MTQDGSMLPHTPNGDIDREQVCNVLLDLLPAYATGTASEDEARYVSAALPLCPEGADALAQYYALLTLMPNAMPPADGAPLPASALLARIGSATTTTAPPAQHSAAASVFPGSHSAAPVPHALPVSRPTAVQRPALAKRAVRKRSSRPWGAYALVALAAIAFGLANVYWSWEVNRIRSSTEAALLQQQQVIAQLQRTAAPAPTPVPTFGAGAVTLNSQHRSLTPTTTLEGMQGVFIWSEQERVGSLYVSGMPPLEPGRAYQLWLMREAGAVAASLGVFTVDAQGAATLIFESSEPIESFSDIGISIEPLSGSRFPTTPNVAAANI